MKLDNGYGDYAMSIFRNKDKIARAKNISRLFCR
jgi:hypothetical protein